MIGLNRIEDIEAYDAGAVAIPLLVFYPTAGMLEAVGGRMSRPRIEGGESRT
jgi:hypothetical protein